jgi:hypothetical protein
MHPGTVHGRNSEETFKNQNTPDTFPPANRGDQDSIIDPDSFDVIRKNRSEWCKGDQKYAGKR